MDNTVTRLYRAAIKVGEDFITIEEQVTLRSDATDDDIAAAVALGLRIFDAQQSAIAQQAAAVRAGRRDAGTSAAAPPDGPATDKQRGFLATLQDKAGWTSEQLIAFASQRGIDLAALTKSQASALIEVLKDGRTSPPATANAPHLPGFEDHPSDGGATDDIPF